MTERRPAAGALTERGPAAHAPRVRTWCLALFCLGLAACGQDGTSRYAGTTQWTDTAGFVRVRYVAPPWNVRGGDAESLLLDVDTVTGPDAGVPSKYHFGVTVETGTAASALAGDRAIGAGRGETIVADTVPITTDSGDVGMRWVGLIPGLYARSYEHVAFDAPGGKVVHIQIESNSDPRTAELDAMIRNVDVLPFDPL